MLTFYGGNMTGNVLVVHGGGPTPVMNASLYGVIMESRKHPEIGCVYGALGGMEGIFKERFVNLSQVDDAVLQKLLETPGTAIGSSRYPVTEEDYEKTPEIMKKYNIRYILPNGGNGTMDTCGRIYQACVKEGYRDLRVVGIPKTIDNDLAVTDHTPGYGSAARYMAASVQEVGADVRSLPIHVCVMEALGRNAGWITAASALYADLMPCEHLVYLPEVAFDKEKFLAAVKEKWAKGRGLLVTISEGIHYADGSPVADSGVVDGFGHKVPGGAAQALSDMIMQETGLKSRSEKPGLLGRVSVALMSEIDQKEAEEAGACAVRSAVEGKTGFMVGFETTRNPYSSKTILIPLEKVANAEKKFPLEWIGEDGASIKPAFKAYCEPLLGAYDSRFISLR